MSLLAEVCSVLRDRGTPHAVIGAAALAVHGVARATADLDLLIVDSTCLDPDAWRPLAERRATVEVRHGDNDDPLAGVVRLSRRGEDTVDVIVGRGAWQRGVLDRARPIAVGDTEVPVAQPADLVLLKLYAGGPQDAWDIDQILRIHPDLVSEVERQLSDVPADCERLWRRIRSDHGS